MKKELATKDDFWAILIISVIFSILMLAFSIVNYLNNELILTKIDTIESELTEFPVIRIEQYKDDVYVYAGNKYKKVKEFLSDDEKADLELDIISGHDGTMKSILIDFQKRISSLEKKESK